MAGQGVCSTFEGVDAAAMERDGFVYVDLLTPELVAPLADLALASVPSPPPPFYASPAHAWGDHAGRFHRDCVALLADPLRRRFPGHRIFMVAATVKGPLGGDVQFHQDWTYTDERRHRALFLWCPLVDVDDGNGVLRVVPGSHRDGPETIRPSTGPARWQVTEMFQEEFLEQSRARPMTAGQAILFDPAVVHGSLPNSGDSFRPAITVALAPDNAELVHFHRSDDGVVSGHAVDVAFFTEHDYARRPVGYREREPWARAIDVADYEAMVGLAPGSSADRVPVAERDRVRGAAPVVAPAPQAAAPAASATSAPSAPASVAQVGRAALERVRSWRS